MSTRVWRPGQNAFFDIRLTNVNENSQKHQTVENILKKHEKEKEEPIIIELSTWNTEHSLH